VPEVLPPLRSAFVEEDEDIASFASFAPRRRFLNNGGSLGVRAEGGVPNRDNLLVATVPNFTLLCQAR